MREPLFCPACRGIPVPSARAHSRGCLKSVAWMTRILGRQICFHREYALIALPICSVDPKSYRLMWLLGPWTSLPL
jgi:hypothetical protein